MRFRAVALSCASRRPAPLQCRIGPLNNASARHHQAIKQAAAYCSCSVWAIRNVIWSRELPACKIGRRYLIDRGDLDRFIDARLRERMP